MIKQAKDETRLEYLSRVLTFLTDHTIAGECTIDYDGTTCDGVCLADDFKCEIELLNVRSESEAQDDT